MQEQTMMKTFRNSWSNSPIPQIKYPTKSSPTKLPVLTQQLMADFQLLQEAWDKLSN